MTDWNDLNDEIRAHLELEIQQNIEAGMSPEDARYAALRKFGNITLTRERTRAVWGLAWLDTLRQDIRYALRTLRRSPGFTAVAVLSLALGIGANTAIFSLIDAILLRMLPVRNPEHLYVLQPRGREGIGAFSYPGFEVLRDQNQVFSDTFTYSAEGERWNVVLNGQAELTNGQLVTANFFSALGVNAIAGRALAPDDDKAQSPVAVISYSYWKRSFAPDPSAIGASITVNGVPVTIVGVMPPQFFGVAIGSAPELWIPMALQPRISRGESALTDANMWWLFAMARLKPGVSEQQARANLDVVLPAVWKVMGVTPESGASHFARIDLQPGGTGTSALRHEFSAPLRILMIVVGLVLLIACANVANLLLARATARGKEIAVRFALGGGRRRLIRQLLTESVLLASLGGALGLVFARWSSSSLVAFLGGGSLPVSLPLHLDFRVLGFAAAVAVLTGILFGLAPALRATRVDPAPALQESARSLGSGGLRFGKALVVLQVAVSLLLLTGAGLFVRTVQNLQKDLGFNPQSVLLMTIEPVLAGYKGP